MEGSTTGKDKILLQNNEIDSDVRMSKDEKQVQSYDLIDVDQEDSIAGVTP